MLDKVKQERDMLWIMPSNSTEIDAIQDELKAKLKHSRLGKTERRSFVPHVLLGKSKTGRFMKWKPENFEPVEFEVGAINLYESELTPGAATHRLMESFALNG
jgi:2'-5' RNA ligase